MTTDHRAGADRYSWLDLGLAASVLALAGLLGCAIIRNSDLWLHLATGRLIASGQYQVGVDPFCFTTAKQTWINHAWAFDWGTYHVMQQFGGAGLVILRAAMVQLIALVLLSIRGSRTGLATSATLTALALIGANGRLPIFQPTLVSLLVLSALVWLLHAGPQWRKPMLLPSAAFVLQVYWVNHDAWFFLGPCLILLWAIGSALREAGTAKAELKRWLVVLVAALAGCLVNPHHVHAFVIPDELAPSFFDPAVANQTFFRSLNLSPLNDDFRRSQPAQVYASGALWSLGLASFVLAFPSRPWPRLFVWLLLTTLALWRARLLPFFAIGTAPLVALNILDWLADLEPSANRQKIGIALRSVLALVVVGLCFAAWPGWLGPLPNNPLRAFRVGLRVEPDAGLEQFTRHLNDLQSQGSLANNERSLSPGNPANDVPNYLTWFAPKMRSFIDSRWRLHESTVGDFLKARQFFVAIDNGQPANLADVTNTLRPYDVSLILLNGSERSDGTGAGRVLLTDPERWPLIAIVGKATAFAWNADARERGPAFDVARIAFGPQAPPHRPAPPTGELQSQSTWEIYAHGMKKKPIALDDAASWTEYTDAAQMRLNAAVTASAVAVLVGSAAGNPSWALQAAMDFHPATAHSPSRVFAPERFAGAIMAIRHGRGALAAQPDNAEAAYRLSQAYTRQASLEPLLTLQTLSALTQAKARLPIMAANGWDESQLAFAIANDLAARHYQLNHFDLFVDNFRSAFDLMRRPAVVLRFPDQKAYEADFNNRKKQLEALEKNLSAQREKFDQTSGQPPIARMVEAERLGLPGEALAVFMRTAQEAPDTLSPRDRAFAIGLMLRLGLVDEARVLLHAPMLEPISAVEQGLQPVLRRLHLEAAAASGDYQRAREELSVLLDLNRLGQSHVQRSTAVALATGVAMDAGQSPFLSQSTLAIWWWLAPLRDINTVAQTRFELLAWQGLLALEEGDTRTAKRAIDEAIEDLPRGIRPAGLEQLQLYRLMLERAAQAAPAPAVP